MTVKQNALISRNRILTAIAVALLIGGVRLTIQAIPSIRVWVVALGIASLFIRGKSTDSNDAPLIFITCVIGMSPILGWIPNLSRQVDPILLLSVASTARGFAALKRRASIHWYLLPLAISCYFGIRRWWQFTQGGPNQVLARLLSGWDHFGHFYLFLSSVRFDSFVARTPELIAGLTSYDRHYPAGIQMNWSQWWPQNRELALLHPTQLLRQYMIVVIVTAAISSALIGISIIRVYRSKTRDIIAISLGISTFMLIFAGPLSITIWNGFPNFLIAIAGVVVVISICVQPLESRILNLVVLFAAISISSYNWYPLLIAIAPMTARHLWLQFGRCDRSWKIPFIAGTAILGFLAVMPILGTFAFGVSHLTVDGGITQLPPNIVVAFVGVALFAGIIQMWGKERKWWNEILSPLIVSPIFLISVATVVRATKHSYPYYVQKISIGTVFICLPALLILKRDVLQTKIEAVVEHSHRRYICAGALGLLLAFSTGQIFGYIGPDWKLLAPSSSNSGLYSNRGIEDQVPARLRTTNLLISLSDASLDQGLQNPDCFVFNDIDMQDYDPVLTNYWVGVLTWTLTEEHLEKSQTLIPLKTGVPDVQKNARIMQLLVEPSRDCPVVSSKLADALITKDERWYSTLWVIKADGNIIKYSDLNEVQHAGS